MRKIKHIFMLVFFLALSTTCFGQSVIDFAKRSDAMEYVGNMAHPMQKVLGAKVLSSGSNYVDISINFKSIGRTYWEDYRININTVRGVKYYSSIDRIRKVSIYAPFGGQRWVRGIMDGIMNYMGYSNSDSEGLRLLYGKSDYGDMSNEQLAAYNLMGLFLEYYKQDLSLNGDYEYEVTVWNVPTEELMKALELCNEEQLMEYIEKNFSNSDGLDELLEIIRTHHIPYDVWAG